MDAQLFKLGRIAELLAREYELDVDVSTDCSLRSLVKPLNAKPREYTHLSHKLAYGFNQNYRDLPLIRARFQEGMKSPCQTPYKNVALLTCIALFKPPAVPSTRYSNVNGLPPMLFTTR